MTPGRTHYWLIGLLALACGSSSDGGAFAAKDSGSDAAADAGSDAQLGADTSTDVVPSDASVGPIGAPLAIDLGPVQEGVPVPVMIPQNALGFQILVHGPGTVGIKTVADPSGKLVVDYHTINGVSGASLFSDRGEIAVTVPQSPDAMPFTSGTWTVTFGFGPFTKATAYVQQTNDGNFHGGLLDLVLYLPKGLVLADPGPDHVVDAKTAPTDAAVSARVDSFYEALFQLFGVSRGSVTFVDIPAVHRTIGSEQELLAAYEQTVPPPSATAVHLVLANGITYFGSPVWGVAAGIPGGSVETGHSSSGIALNVSAGFPAVADGYTLVHELGHFIGLFHTTQQGNTSPVFDPLTDTPQCPSYPAPGCPDASNIMFATFWGASGGIGVVSSPQQRAVFRAASVYSPLLRAATSKRKAPAAELGSSWARHTAGPGWPYRRSGRALSEAERWLAAGLCGHVPIGSPLHRPTRTELTRLAGDPDLVPILRERAQRLGLALE